MPGDDGTNRKSRVFLPGRSSIIAICSGDDLSTGEKPLRQEKNRNMSAGGSDWTASVRYWSVSEK